MNIITISDLDQFNSVTNDLLCLSGKQAEETYHNMWCISLERNFAESVTLEQLKDFVDTLIQKREQQLQKINFFKNAVFYMWFDQQALQLRFNIITGDVQTCPFGCKVQLYTIAEPILSGAYVVFSVPFEVRYGIHIKKKNCLQYGLH